MEEEEDEEEEERKMYISGFPIIYDSNSIRIES